MSFHSDGSVHREGPGQPSPMVGVIAQAVASMIAKKKAEMETGAGTSEAANGESEESEAMAMPFSSDPVTLLDENGEPETWFFVKTDGEGNPLPWDAEHVGGASSSNGGGAVATEEVAKKKNNKKGKKKQGGKKK
eukprot:symbB.v1.2.001794.t1/scaffold95.1/size600632/42